MKLFPGLDLNIFTKTNSYRSLILPSHLANLIGIDTVHHQVLSGVDLDQLSEIQLEKIINNVSIFYRVTPKHKVIIVKVCRIY